MATTVKSVDLDFDNIKNRLKEYFQAQSEFQDYDFEASGLSNILDVLAYNTHINALTANFAVNEAFLSSAQLRSSVVSHAETLGYDIRSRTSSKAIVNLSLNLAGVLGRPAAISLPSGKTFTSSINGTTYTFRTLETYVARDDGTGLYTFKNADGDTNINIYEGVERTKTFFAGQKDERQIYVIPDETIDKSTASVAIYDTSSSSNFTSYFPLTSAVQIDANSTYFTIREAPNGNYELNFGDGTSFGKSPDPGNKIVVTYLSSSGPDANDGTVFIASSDVNVDGIDYPLSVTTVSQSAGGAEKQSIESIRQLAPIAYASQQRLVTSLDYKATILSNYTQVKDVSVWSGDEHDQINYGKVYISLNFQPNLTDETKTAVKNSIVNDFADRLSVMSIDVLFEDPKETFVEVDVNFDFDPALTGQTIASTEDQVFRYLSTYFSDNLELFARPFRKSNLATEIDALNAGILSTRMDVKVQQRFTPTLGSLNTLKLVYPSKLRYPDPVINIISSTVFEINGKLAQIINKLNETKLQVVDLEGNVIVDNVGSYDTQAGTVDIIGFAPDIVLGGVRYIKMSAVPEIENTIQPLRNYILKLDKAKSSATAQIDRQTTSLKVTI